MKWVAGALALGALSLSSPEQAHAIIPGMPSIVYDPSNHSSGVARYGQLVLQARQQLKEIQHAADQVKHAREQARGFSRFRLGNLNTFLDRAERTFGRGVALGHGNSRLDEMFRKNFPEVPKKIDGVEVQDANQLNMIRSLSHAALVSSRDQNVQLNAAQRVMATMRSRMESARTAHQIQQAQGAISAFQAEQDMMTRHVLLSINSQLAAANARAVQKDMREQMAEAEQRADAEAWEAHRKKWEEQVEAEQRRRREEMERNAAGRRTGGSGVGAVAGTGGGSRGNDYPGRGRGGRDGGNTAVTH